MEHRFQINLQGIIELLSDHLYSKPEVFLREVLQNAVDAITARSKEDPNLEGDILLSVSRRPGNPTTLEISDNGIGLTEEEVHRFLAVIAESSKRTIDGKRSTDYLGQFGIGLLSCFFVSEEIVVVTRSAHSGNPAVEWRGRRDGTYLVRVLETDISPGTRVYLTCRPEREDLFQPDMIKQLAFHFGALLPFPVRIATPDSTTVINENGAPWRQAYASEKARVNSLLRYGRDVFDTNFLDAIPLQSSAGRVEGVAFVLPYAAKLNARRSHRVYLRNMLLSEDADNLLPDWAFFVKAVVNANDLRPTASRESFFEDERLDAARVELGECLRKYLVEIAERDSRRFESFLGVHHVALKALAAEDEECFRLFIDWLPFETTRGHLPLRDLRANSQKLLYTDNIAEFRQMEKLAIAQGLTLINAGYSYEPQLLSQLRDVFPNIDLERLDPASLVQEFEELELNEQDRAHDLLAVATEVLRPLNCQPEARKFSPSELPAVFLAGEEARFLRSIEQSKETADQLFQGILDGIKSRHHPVSTQLVLNFNNALIRRLSGTQNRTVLRRAVQVLFVQGLLLAHQPLTSKELALLSQGLSGLVEAAITSE